MSDCGSDGERLIIYQRVPPGEKSWRDLPTREHARGQARLCIDMARRSRKRSCIRVAWYRAAKNWRNISNTEGLK